MKNVKELLELVIKAHGGLEQWNNFTEVTAKLSIGGVTWAFKGQDGVLNNVSFRALLHKQYGNYMPIDNDGRRSVFEAERVAIKNIDGSIAEELLNPRASFAGHIRETKWTKLQLVYFASYAMWTYLTLPFNFNLPGFKFTELDAWVEGNETWRKLEVTFPDYLETHSKKQVFYYGEDGLLRRHDYWAEVLGGLPAAHYVSDYKNFSGIMLPTKRRVFGLNEDKSYRTEPIFVAIDVIDATFS
jgi:hypothetical protein